MLDFIPYGFLPWYPHMSTADTEIWRRFLLAYPTQFDAVIYDLAVGSGPEFDHTAGGILGDNIKRLWQKRIDVVGKKNDNITIIEIKPAATPYAFGQLQAYAALFERDYDPFLVEELLVITDIKLPDMDFLAHRAGIKIMVV